MPIKAPPYVAVSTWTGLYFGANLGGGWGNRNFDFEPNDPVAVALFDPGGGGAPRPGSFNSWGAIGGLQIGYNWQFNPNWLVGLETDFDWANIDGSNSSSGTFIGLVPFTSTADEHIKSLGTVRARLGYLPMDSLLTYVTGGFAYGRVEHAGAYVSNGGPPFSLGPRLSCASGATCFNGSRSSMATGWTAGAGFEYALWQKWTFKAEYLYVSLSGSSLTETALVSTPGFAPSTFNLNYGRTNFSVARVGVNYRF